MITRVQVILTLRYDDKQHEPPHAWDWPTLLDIPNAVFEGYVEEMTDGDTSE